MITRFFIAFFSIVHLNTKIVLISFFSKNQFVRIVYFDFKKKQIIDLHSVFKKLWTYCSISGRGVE